MEPEDRTRWKIYTRLTWTWESWLPRAGRPKRCLRRTWPPRYVRNRRWLRCCLPITDYWIVLPVVFVMICHSFQVVTEYESGKAIPNQQILAKMERALGLIFLEIEFDIHKLSWSINYSLYIATQAWNCEARTRASPWKLRPRVLLTSCLICTFLSDGHRTL